MTVHATTDEVLVEHFADDGTFPNSRLPALIYLEALAPDAVNAEALEALFARNRWPPAWQASIFTFHHYHSTAHEALGVAYGEATIMLGGPDGREFRIAAGDVLVIPAGVAHIALVGSPDFLVVGAYPPGQDFDLLRGQPGERPQADENIARVPLPESDPVGGRTGPLIRAWSVAG